MNDAILAVVISGAIQIVGLIANSNLTKYRIEQLEKKVDKHNGLVEKMVEVEQSTKSAHHRLDSVEGEVRGLLLERRV